VASGSFPRHTRLRAVNRGESIADDAPEARGYLAFGATILEIGFECNADIATEADYADDTNDFCQL